MNLFMCVTSSGDFVGAALAAISRQLTIRGFRRSYSRKQAFAVPVCG